MCKDVIVCCLTHGRGQNGGGSRGNPGIMLSHISISSRLAHLPEFSRDGASRVQNFTWMDSPFLIFPKSNNSGGSSQGLAPWAQPPLPRSQKDGLGQRKVAHFICCIFY